VSPLELVVVQQAVLPQQPHELLFPQQPQE
jgi:hypothetical protein